MALLWGAPLALAKGEQIWVSVQIVVHIMRKFAPNYEYFG